MATGKTGDNLGNPVTTTSFSWADMVHRAWGSEFFAPDHDIYKFSNGRGFDSTDKTNHGIYAGNAK